MSSVTEKIKEEFLKVLPPTIFFFVILHIVALIRTLMVRETGITPTTTASVLISSLILGKSVLIADMLPFINRFPDKPLVWNVSWKTLMYTLVALVIHYLERLYDFWKETHNFAAANHELLTHVSWPRFWAVQILLLTLIFNYCVIAELARALGKKRLKTMFFGPLPKASKQS
ncbi:hypothetical protein [Paraburkholderia fynbosensis]|uniref:Uncharacterized protein n=1 Tax=Paraburkholderia fynbosensis TaxID=1200993 RepID=A0A6J5GZ25_9BURK|nr:hypothetical protein [Paraburkholderia fynbosensis]CAB3809608.1 hypothetical protein LMG27177_06847 [Paraburkholderia fynbosensis]